jgi:hypothetical protein
MNLRTLPKVVLLLLLAAVLCPLPEQASACAPAPPRGKTVAIADESAIILWDAASKTQHFIRRASFKSDAAEFGFLVPTPTKPEVEEASDETFAELAKITAPKVITKPRSEAGGGCAIGCGAAAPGGAAPKSSVRVLEEKQLPGHKATVLEADDANALSKWLGDHGFDYSPALTEWVAPYVKAGWKITAFQIIKRDADKDVASSAVRLTFQADKTALPFFPYREPASQAAAGAGQLPSRLLRVFFIGDKRVQGTVGEKGNPWPGKVAWSNRLDASVREQLLGLLKLPAKTTPESWWLTEFEDASSPRPGTDDAFFSPSEDQKPVEREPITRFVSNAAVDGVLWYGTAACVALPYFIGRWRRRAKAA